MLFRSIIDRGDPERGVQNVQNSGENDIRFMLV